MIASEILLLTLAPTLALATKPRGPTGDTCTFPGPGPAGVSDAVCVGSDGNAHEDKLTCPNAADAANICGANDSDDYVKNNCKNINGGGTYCTLSKIPTDDYEGYFECYCINGNFCCNQNARMSGGEDPIAFFKDKGCSCGAEL